MGDFKTAVAGVLSGDKKAQKGSGGSLGSRPIDYIFIIRKFCLTMNFLNCENRLSISVLRKHGSTLRKTDRSRGCFQFGIFGNCIMLGHMLWFFNIRKKLALVWSLRPLLASLINFGIALECVTDQVWLKIQQTEYNSCEENRFLDSVAVLCGLFKFLSVTIRMSNPSLTTRCKTTQHTQSK